MMRTIYRGRVIGSLRSKEMLIWTWIFPLMLASLFYFAFSELDSAEQWSTIPVGIVEDSAYQENIAFSQFIEVLSGEEGLLLAEGVDSVEEGKELLRQEKAEAILFLEDGTPKMLTRENGWNSSILKGVLDRYCQTEAAILDLIKENPENLEKISDLVQTEVLTEETSLTSNPPTETLGYYYALLAMVCLYGGFQGMESIYSIQANLSALGARRSLAPVKKFQMVFVDLMGGLTVHLLGLLISLAYILGILRVDFGDRLGWVVLTCLVGSMAGISFGSLIGVSTRMKETAKTAVVVAASMVCCFLAGLMVSGINYLVAIHIPILSWLNPAARISDAFRALYCYDSLGPYFVDLGVLLAITVLFFAGTAFFLRRQRYESI
ncbi:ABC transporter permease [Hominifimenecus sp. rT4P-3]|uniref:ABC transporter permease n=1 Tax=Hominifimenecus sp. rT4P-3 TaxID=3242979 RepID=UPI003DA35503